MKAKYRNIIPYLAGIYVGHLNHSRKTVSLRAAKRGAFIDELEAGANITERRGEAIVQWLSDYWPSDLEWPSDIPRPAVSGEAA